MEERRFDDLTRTLGTATSRRQVFKGLLGGLVAAVGLGSLTLPDVAAAGCSVRKCKEEALKETFLYQSTNCKSICQDPKLVLGCIGCQITANRLHRQWVKDCETGDGCLAVTGQTCCGSACVDLTHDPSNCGSCGQSCAPGETCQGGQCTCGEQGLICDGQCIDPQANAQHCGSCDHACATCETCVGGQCGAVECGDGELCCHDQCIDVTGDHDNCGGCGVVCGAQQVCLHRACQCPTTTCPTGKTLDPETCQCVCSTTCPTGQTQDPETCQCQDRCAGKTCGECQTCDPDSGNCIQAQDNTDCGNGNICCQGSCVAGPTCSGVCQGQPQGTPCGAPGYCCVNDTTCHNPVDSIGYDNHCCLQYDVWCSVLGQCTTGADCCQAMAMGEYCGSTEHNEPICCGGGGVCCGGGGYFFPGSQGVCAPSEDSCP